MNKKIIFIAIGIIIIVIIILFVFRRTPYSIARQQLGFNLNKNCIIDTFSEKWCLNGDGFVFIVFSIPITEIERIKQLCIDNKFKKLPIQIDNPLSLNPEINKIILQSDSNGYYNLEIDSSDKRNYNLSVLSITHLKLIISIEVF
jgi:hypothetical protein